MVVTSCQLVGLYDAGQTAVVVLGHKDVKQQARAGDGHIRCLADI